MGRWRSGNMSDAKKAEPEEELLEFLGGIDEVNDESRPDDVSDVLASTDVDKLADRKPQAPDEKEQKSE